MQKIIFAVIFAALLMVVLYGVVRNIFTAAAKGYVTRGTFFNTRFYLKERPWMFWTYTLSSYLAFIVVVGWQVMFLAGLVSKGQ